MRKGAAWRRAAGSSMLLEVLATGEALVLAIRERLVRPTREAKMTPC